MEIQNGIVISLFKASELLFKNCVLIQKFKIKIINDRF